MALPGGSNPETPMSRWQRLLHWLGFIALVGRLVTVGFGQWILRRWILRDPNVY